MARKGTLGYRAGQARKKAQRRIEQLNAVLSDTNASQRLREFAKAQKKEITSAIQGTRQYSKDGKRYKSKTTKYIENQITRLTEATEAVLPRLSTKPTRRQQRINAFTQHQINLASVRPNEQKPMEPSIYTREEVSVFYRALQDVWQKPGVTIESRNDVILNYFNEERLLRGLKPLTLKDIIDATVRKNSELINALEIESSLKTGNSRYDEITRETMERQNKGDKEGSPTAGIPQAVFDAFRDLLFDEIVTINPEDI